MLRQVKPKNARAKRALDNKEAKINENTKQALFVPGMTSNQILHDSMVDLCALKLPDGKRFGKKNDITPFEDASSLEFFSEKNDSSLLVLSSNSKKRPNNLTWVRTFGYELYDMIELQIVNHRLLNDFKSQTFGVGLKPMFTFNGNFDTEPALQHVKSLFLDFFRGDVTDLQDAAGLQFIISVSAGEVLEDKPLPLINFRVYKIRSFRSGQKLPRIELEEIGPRFDFKIGRRQSPAPEVEKEAMRIPEQLRPKVKKNVEMDVMGDKIGRVHVGKQDLGKLQTRKMKGLKKKYDQVEDDEGADGEVVTSKKARVEEEEYFDE